MNVIPGSGTKDYSSVIYYWKKVRMGCCQKWKACNEYTHKLN